MGRAVTSKPQSGQDFDLVSIALDELEDAAKGWSDDNVYERAHRAAVPALARLQEQLEALEGRVQAALLELGRASDVRANRTGIIGNVDLILRGSNPASDFLAQAARPGRASNQESEPS